MQKQEGLVLFTRLPDYFYQCLLFFAKKFNYHCRVVVYQQDANTSFHFETNDFISFIPREKFKPEEYYRQNFRFVYCGSWRDSDYKSVCRHYKGRIPVIVGLDNPWLGSLKQWLRVALSFLTIRPYFNRIWVAGQPQYAYARKLGFDKDQIMRGLYSADTGKFHNRGRQPAGSDLRKILFVGRFVEYKNPHLLAEVFSELIAEDAFFLRWKLLLTGRGPLKARLQLLAGQNIEIHDFVPPSQLPQLFQAVDIFCLPSTNEHWGVVVHEAAASGLPMLLSDSVAAGTAFLREGENGYTFQSGNRESLKKQLKKMLLHTDQELQEMSKRSAVLSREISLQSWAEELKKQIQH